MIVSEYIWGTVTAVSPLRVLLDGDLAAIPSTPDTLIDPDELAVDDRVRCELASNRLIIHGRSGGLLPPPADPPDTNHRSLIDNGSFRINQRGYVSGAALAVGEYGFDRWRCSGITNLVINPSLETNSTGWGDNSAGFTESRVTSGHAIPGISTERSAFFRLTANTTVAAEFGMLPSAYTPVPVGASMASIYVRSSKTQRVIARVELSGGEAVTIQGDETVLVANTWTRLSVPIAVTKASTSARLYVYGKSGTSFASWVTNDTFDFDAMMITVGAGLWPFHDGATADSIWTGTTDASSSTRGCGSGTTTFTAAPQGQELSLASGKGISQIIERANVAANTYTLSWSGTQLGRIYNVGTDPNALPALAASPVVVALDGLDDVVVEFGNVTGSTKTLGQVQLEVGSSATPFDPLPLLEDLMRCRRTFYVIEAGDLSVYNPYWNVALSAGMQLINRPHPVPMVRVPQDRTAAGSTFHSFSYLSYTAAGAVNYNVDINATVEALLANYSSGDNGGSTLAVGRTAGVNNAPIHFDAEF